MKKVLVVITTGMASWGGLTTVMMNYYRAMNKDNIQIDFLADNTPDEKLLMEIESSTSRYYKVSSRKKSLFKYMRELSKILKINKYDVIHVNGNSSTMAIELIVAKHCGVAKRIAHVHNTVNEHKILNAILHPVMRATVTDQLAVSNIAGKYLYKLSNYSVLNNAIDCDRFYYNYVSRECCREELGFDENDFVIGTIGKLNHRKNQVFLLEILPEILKIRPSAKLLIVGEGETRIHLEKRVRELDIEKSIVFAGLRTDTPELLSAMDTFVLPSFFEGLCLALLEAQAAGLPCYVTDTLAEEGIISDDCHTISLSEKSVWIDKLANIDVLNREKSSKIAIQKLGEAGYNIKSQGNILRNIYLNE